MGASLDALGTGAVSFDHPELLWFVVGLPAAVSLGVWAWTRRRRRAARVLGSSELLARLGAGDLSRFPATRTALLVVAAGAIGMAAAGPRWGLESVEERTSSADLVLALDVSKSMLARDVAPNRLERERVFARRLLRELPTDRIGLVAFAGRAYVLAPLTVDHGALQLYLDALDPEIAAQCSDEFLFLIGYHLGNRELFNPGALKARGVEWKVPAR